MQPSLFVGRPVLRHSCVRRPIAASLMHIREQRVRSHSSWALFCEWTTVCVWRNSECVLFCIWFGILIRAVRRLFLIGSNFLGHI